MTDAYGALSYLSSLPFVDEERVLLMGFSHGGSATIHALQPTSWLPPDSPRFMAGVAMYPYCSANMRRLYAPLTIIIGEKDDWTPAVLCVGSASGTDVPVHVIPNTHHGFDSFPWKGEPEGPVVNQWGKTWSPSHTATERARQLVDSFLKTCCTEDTPRQHRQAPVETVTEATSKGITIQSETHAQEVYKQAEAHCRKHRKKSSIIQANSITMVYKFVCY